jgi:hypothetical protein
MIAIVFSQAKYIIVYFLSQILYIYLFINTDMHQLIEFQYSTVNEFVRQVLEGNVLSTIEDNYGELNNLYKKINEWINKSYENDFDFNNDENLKQITKDIFDQIIYLRLTGKLTGILSLHKFGKS